MSLRKSQSGFTLIELVLALGIFSILLIILVGFYSRFVNQQRNDVLKQRLIENVRFATDLFSRETRTAFGSTFVLADSDARGVIFRNQNNLCVQYRLTANNIERAEVDHRLPECTSDIFTDAIFQPLVSSDLEIISSSFEITPASVVDGKLASQGYITLALSIAPKSTNVAPVSLQTTVTSRQVSPYRTNP